MNPEADMSEETRKPAEKKKTIAKAASIGFALPAIAVIARVTGLTNYVSLDDLDTL